MLRGENPPKAAIQQRLDNGDAEQTTWLRKIACQESLQRQFATVLNPSLFRYPGEPLMSSDGLGGAGVMQITKTDRLPEGPGLAELWDWRANVDEGKRVFADKLSEAQNYPEQVRRCQGFRDIVEMTNRWRELQGKPPLDQVIVPDFQKWQADEDAVRGYNGRSGTPEFRCNTGAGESRLVLHEFRLRKRIVRLDGMNVQILELANERQDSQGRLIADAIWERTPVSLRQGGCPNYVECVRRQAAHCPTRTNCNCNP